VLNMRRFLIDAKLITNIYLK
jgi:hypothetical protein